MAKLIGQQPFHGCATTGRRYDCGNRLGFLEANIAFALAAAGHGGDETRALLERSADRAGAMRIAMIGTGYVGLVSGACFAEFGHRRGLRRQGRRQDRARCRKGEIPIYEPGLDALVADNVRRRPARPSPPTSRRRCGGADAVFIAVGTPSRRGDGHADLSYVFAAAEEIAGAISGYTVVVTKSTVPVGTGREVQSIIREPRPDAADRRRLQPGIPARGRGDRRLHAARPRGHRRRERAGARRAAALYRPLNLIETPILFTRLETAELIKYAANAFLATKITFINEIADLCEKVGADVHDVARGMGLDGRIGRKFLHAGPGYRRLVLPQGHAGAGPHRARGRRAAVAWSRQLIEVNDARKKRMAEQGHRRLRRLGRGQDRRRARASPSSRTPTTCATRPSLVIVPALQAAGAKIVRLRPGGHERGAASCCRASTFARTA